MTTVTRKLDMENLCIGEFGRYYRHAKFQDGDRTMCVTVLCIFSNVKCIIRSGNRLP